MQKIKKEKNKKKLKKEGIKGITLIALVITIIVLLILAGVSIATLTGDNGILTKATTAKEETEKASEEEQRQLAQLNATMHTENTEKYKTEDGKEVPIPVGFAPTEIEGENSTEDGVVITDENGNEFVWIPCTKEEFNKQRKEESGWSEKQWWYNGGQWGDSQPNKLEIQNSIKNNGGFYVGRYEAGIPKEAPFYTSLNSSDLTYKNNYEEEKFVNKRNDFNGATDPARGGQTIDKNIIDKLKPVSRRGVQAWNFINQTNAKKVSENMVSNNGVQSYLIDSHAWDTTCRVIKKYAKKDLINSTTWGNYYNNITTKYEDLNTLFAVHSYSDDAWTFADKYEKGQVTEAPKGKENNRLELSTGASDDFKAYNIYDFAGNMWEWTTENGQRATSSVGTGAMGEIKTTDQTGRLRRFPWWWLLQLWWRQPSG